MKAILLCAGKGKRLRPVTNDTPKCLLPLCGKTLLEWWLDNLDKHGVEEVLINGHYLADKIKTFLAEKGGNYKLGIKYVFEEELLGTGGTVKNNFDFIKNEKLFFLAHGDNFTNIDISSFKDFHKKRETDLSIALFKTTVPEQCGIVEEIDEDGRIVKFTEKPEAPASDLASAAIFIMSPSVVKSFPDKKHIDLSKEVVPLFMGKMYGFKMKGVNVDIGTPANYGYAQKIAKELKNENS